MSIRWRIGLAAIIAVAIVGGFVPHGVLSVADTSAPRWRGVEAPLSGSVNCADATCGKGNTAPAAPSPGIALVAVVAGVLGVRQLPSASGAGAGSIRASRSEHATPCSTLRSSPSSNLHPRPSRRQPIAAGPGDLA